MKPYPNTPHTDPIPPQAGNVWFEGSEPEDNDDPMTGADLVAVVVLVAIGVLGATAALNVIWQLFFKG